MCVWLLSADGGCGLVVSCPVVSLRVCTAGCGQMGVTSSLLRRLNFIHIFFFGFRKQIFRENTPPPRRSIKTLARRFHFSAPANQSPICLFLSVFLFSVFSKCRKTFFCFLPNFFQPCAMQDPLPPHRCVEKNKIKIQIARLSQSYSDII